LRNVKYGLNSNCMAEKQDTTKFNYYVHIWFRNNSIGNIWHNLYMNITLKVMYAKSSFRFDRTQTFMSVAICIFLLIRFKTFSVFLFIWYLMIQALATLASLDYLSRASRLVLLLPNTLDWTLQYFCCELSSQFSVNNCFCTVWTRSACSFYFLPYVNFVLYWRHHLVSDPHKLNVQGHSMCNLSSHEYYIEGHVCKILISFWSNTNIYVSGNLYFLIDQI
jgi:hypothetical protein